MGIKKIVIGETLSTENYGSVKAYIEADVEDGESYRDVKAGVKSELDIVLADKIAEKSGVFKALEAKKVQLKQEIEDLQNQRQEIRMGI